MAGDEVAFTERAGCGMVNDPWPWCLHTTTLTRLPMSAPTYFEHVATHHHGKLIFDRTQRLVVVFETLPCVLDHLVLGSISDRHVDPLAQPCLPQLAELRLVDGLGSDR